MSTYDETSPVYVNVPFGSIGTMCAALIRNVIPQAVIVVTYYNKPFPYNKIPMGSNVIIIGLSYKLTELQNIAEGYTLTWFSHSREDIEDATRAGLNMSGSWEEDLSVIEQIYNFYYESNDYYPDAVRFLADYDKWELSLPETLPFHYGLMIMGLWTDERSLAKAKDILANQNNIMDSILAKGKVIHDFIVKRDTAVANDIVHRATIEGIDGEILVANIRGINSLFFENLKSRYSTIKACVAYGYCHDSKQYRFSIYSNDSTLDVGKVAQKFGGGGRPGVAGWSSADIPFKPIYEESEKNFVDHLAEMRDYLRSSNPVRLYNKKFHRIPKYALNFVVDYLGFKALFFNTPYTYPDQYYEIDGENMDLAVSWCRVNNGKYRLAVHNLSNMDMEDLASKVPGAKTITDEEFWVYVDDIPQLTAAICPFDLD